VAAARYWSVERDGDTVVATCPEVLRYVTDNRPEWMAGFAAALRDELRLLEIQDGTLLEATLTGALPPGVGLENVLLYNVGIPQAQVTAGARMLLLPPGDGGFVQRYRRGPIAPSEPGDAGERLAAVVVPLPDGSEFESAREVWRAVRGTGAAGDLAAAGQAPGEIDLRVRLLSGSIRRLPGVELVHRLLDGVRASLQDGADADIEEAARRLDDRIRAAEVVFVPGGTAQLEIELRAVVAAASD
jgi:hypothetical protein